MMTLIWAFLLSVFLIDFTEAVDPNESSFVSVDSGQNVTLPCRVEKAGEASKVWVWYRQRAGQEPQQVATRLIAKDPTTESSRFKIKEHFSLTVENATKDDEGMYFCGSMEKTVKFYNGTFLAVPGTSQLNISVLQTPALKWVPPGEAVNLQCRVLSEIRSAELGVFWIRSAAGSSFPEIIYTHHDSSSRQCETSSSKHSCVYNFSTIIPNNHHAATYYCAVQTCGRVIIGNGTPVNFKEPADLMVLYLGAALGICVVVIIVLSLLIHNVRPQEDSEYVNVASQDTVELIKKKRHSGESVYSEVSYFTVDDANQTR